MYSYVRAVQDGRMDIPGFIREAKRIGADGVELLDFFMKDPVADRRAALEALSETCLPCGVFSVGNNFAKSSAEERASQLARIENGIEQAVHHGAGVVRVFAGDTAEGITFEDARAWIVEGLATAADLARDRNVKLALENHGKLAGRGDQVRAIVQDVRDRCGHDALGANPDTGNFLLVDQESHEAIRQVADVAYMVHFKDFAPYDGEGGYTALSGRKFRGTVIGEGGVDLGACVAELESAGFEGWLNLEYEGEGDPFVDVPASLENTKRFAQARASSRT
jgi:sugar phosphate isomerase/epimerase